MNDRLNILMRERNITPNQLAKMLDIQPSAVSHILSGRNRPGYSVIVKMLEAFSDINPRWLLYGSGDMYEAGVIKVPAAAASFPVTEENAAQKVLFSEDFTGVSVRIPQPSDNTLEDMAAFAPSFGIDTETGNTLRNVSIVGPDPERHSPDAGVATDPDTEPQLAPLSEGGNDESGRKTGSVQNAEIFNSADKSSRIKQIVLIYDDNTFETLDRR